MYQEPKDLWIVNQARHLSNQIVDCVEAWPSFHQWNLGQQLVRSADSVCLNIVEGQGRQSVRDKVHFLIMSRGSLEETIDCIRTGISRELVEDNLARTWLLQYFRLSKALNAYISFNRGKL